jgi:hypothetical protein
MSQLEGIVVQIFVQGLLYVDPVVVLLCSFLVFCIVGKFHFSSGTDYSLVCVVNKFVKKIAMTQH